MIWSNLFYSVPLHRMPPRPAAGQEPLCRAHHLLSASLSTGKGRPRLLRALVSVPVFRRHPADARAG